jgi:hypothetical protein
VIIAGDVRKENGVPSEARVAYDQRHHDPASPPHIFSFNAKQWRPRVRRARRQPQPLRSSALGMNIPPIARLRKRQSNSARLYVAAVGTNLAGDEYVFKMP